MYGHRGSLDEFSQNSCSGSCLIPTVRVKYCSIYSAYIPRHGAKSPAIWHRIILCALDAMCTFLESMMLFMQRKPIVIEL